MTDIDTRPQVINIDCPAGDTLTINLTVDSAVVAGRTFTGQVRQTREGSRLDASFVCTPTAGGATAVLVSADTQHLARRGKYVGYWDVQLAGAGGTDPVTTLAGGELRIHPDVTREAT